MLKKIVRGYGAALVAILRFVALLACAVAAGALIVWPLWRLADSRPGLYTLIFTVLFAAIALALFAGRIREAIKRDLRAFALSVARKLTVLAGLAGAAALVLAHRRAFAIAALLVALALYGLLAFGLAPTRRSPPESE